MVQRSLQLYRDSFSGLSKEVWSLSGVMLINRAGTMVLPFLSVYLTQQLGFSLGQAGWIMSFFGAGSVLGAYLGGQLTDRIGFYETQFWPQILGFRSRTDWTFPRCGCCCYCWQWRAQWVFGKLEEIRGMRKHSAQNSRFAVEFY
ncbi:MAG: hypothetical protein GVY26_18990 [Bacteroidetes bacterium]|jgi:MFS family permease|nr:hypothetical protein [Bacteroidota bacterium]